MDEDEVLCILEIKWKINEIMKHADELVHYTFKLRNYFLLSKLVTKAAIKLILLLINKSFFF